MTVLARLHVPPGVTDEAAIGAFAEALEKALKNPLPKGKRGWGRRDFEALKRSFRVQVHAIFGGVDDLIRTATILRADDGMSSSSRYHLEQLIKRTHRRSVAQVNALLDRSYLSAFECGLRAGGANTSERGLLPNEKKIVRRQRLNENAYADNFLTDIEHREGSMEYRKRADLYVNALEELYWQGFVYADLSADRYLKWTMKGSETCIDCSYLAGSKSKLTGRFLLTPGQVEQIGAGGRWGNGVYSARELATMAVTPQSGKLACTTRCHCRLVPVERPEGKPRFGEARFPFESLEHKDFTGTGTGVDGGIVVHRQAKQKRRKGYAKKAARTEHRHAGREK